VAQTSPHPRRQISAGQTAQMSAHPPQHRLVGGGEPFQSGADAHTRRRVGDERGSDLTQDGHDGGLRRDPDRNARRNSSMTGIIHPTSFNSLPKG